MRRTIKETHRALFLALQADAKERNELEPLLLEMIKAATELLQLVRGS